MKNIKINPKRVILGILLLALFFLLFYAGKTNAQSVEFESASISTGRTPLTQGISVSTSFTKGENNLFLLFNNNLGMAIYTRPVTKWLSVQGTGGIFLNVPWAGPSIALSLFEGKIQTTNWIGWSLGTPEDEIATPEVLFNFSYQEIKYVQPGWELTYLFQNYEDNRPIHLAGFTKKFPLGKKFILSAGVSYILPSEDILWSLEIKYKNK